MGAFSLDRRSFLGAAAAAPLISQIAASAERTLPPIPTQSVATDAGYWEKVSALYKVSPSITNFENGYWGVMPEPVREEFKRLSDFVNFENTVWARPKGGAALEEVRVEVANALGCAKEEIALTRGATEALQLLIAGYNRLKPGDKIMYADLDYDSMQYAMTWLQGRRGVELVKFAIPEPATRANVLAAYEEQLRRHPTTKLLLLTHISHRTGLMIPVKEIGAMARTAGVDVIVDAAHSWGQIDFKVADLGVDFVGFNLHKWIGAPLGAGALYIKASRLADIDRAYGDEDFKPDDVRSRVHTGTTNFATFLSVPTALKLHQEIGPAAKEARFRHLRDRWVKASRDIPNLEILTPDDPSMAAGITSFRFAGKTTADANNAIVNALRDQHGIMTVRRAGIAKGHAIRVTPAPFITEADCDKLSAALRALAKA
ncbi:aminotransferase class V-fold PLP-dependent enzyme [Terrarubrum flagellatum]|uniref:aminotransferase class V-fold PLP-dependent enzyme n=1 Tax=Terrirubrum flagellatum TaxID=2895980 RepID=UPI0031451AF1